MSLITRNNYEAFMLDYVEGNLSPEQIAALMLFLENNPDLKEELNDFELHHLKPIDEVLMDKEELKKAELITEANYEDYLIAEIEGENSAEISIEIKQFLEKDPNKLAEFKLYQNTILAGASIVFEDKESLKKKETEVIPIYWWYASAAAVILILFLFKGLNLGDNNQENNPIADQVEEKIAPSVHDKQNEIQKNEVEVQEEIPVNNTIADVVENKSKAPVNRIKKKQPIEKQETPPEEVLPDNPIVENNNPNSIKDTLPTIVPQENEIIEDDLYADDVTIIYEDETEEPSKTDKKELPNRFQIIKEILNQRVKSKFLQQDKNKDGEVTAYAVDIAGVGFSKTKRKFQK